MNHLIRKITIGKDYKNDAMHYAVGQEVYGGHTICDILEEEDKYIISEDQIYLYNNKAMPGYSFVQPIKSNNKLTSDIEQPLVGIIKYTDGAFGINTLVGFTPNSEYEFVIDGKRLYRVLNKFITIKYEYKGNEEEYNPSWAKSSR